MGAEPSGPGCGGLLEVQGAAQRLTAGGDVDGLLAPRTDGNASQEAVLAWYYVDTITGEGLERDEGGVELVDDEAARRMAWTWLGEVLAAMPDPPGAPVIVVVTDQNRQPIYHVTAHGNAGGAGGQT